MRTERDELALAIARHLRSLEGTGEAWGIEIEDAGEGWARIAMTLTPEMLNGFRIGHGGMVFGLADTAFAYACNSRNVRTVAQSATVHFLSPAPAGARLIAEAREVRTVGRSGTYVVTVSTEEGETVAVFHGLSRTIGGEVVGPESR